MPTLKNIINLPFGITSGEQDSIAPILTLLAWQKIHGGNNCFFAIDNIDNLQKVAKEYNLDIPMAQITKPAQASQMFNHALPVLHIKEEILGEKSLAKAIELAKSKEIKAILTNPISKEIMIKKKSQLTAHTEYLEKAFNINGTMLLYESTKNFGVVPITRHIPLKDVAPSITKEKITQVLHHVQDFIKNKDTKVVILGLNPHAGENGQIGQEEAIIKKTIEGTSVIGPLSADGIFHNEEYTKDTIVIGMYHDQVLIPFKMLYFTSGINITLGLPVLRVSPCHGTAFDLRQKKQIPDLGSFLNAIDFIGKYHGYGI